MTNWVTWYQNVKPFCILLQQQMMEMVVVTSATLKHVQIIQITTTNIPIVSFLKAGCPSHDPHQHGKPSSNHIR